MNENKYIIVVSGLPRSGTSLMMQLLQAAGIPVLIDDHRPPDENNPKGYFEFEAVKSLATDASWLPLTKGKAVKIISHLLPYLPEQFQYKIIFMNRDLKEIIRSQNKMLDRFGKAKGELSEAKLAERYALHLHQVHQWLKQRPDITFADISFNHLIQSPEKEWSKVQRLLNLPAFSREVFQVIKPELYRTKNTQL